MTCASTFDIMLQEMGFFIECGALDGERSSNTIFFEQKRGWTGLLIEMDPSWYLQLRGKNRKSFSINACISPHQYPIKVGTREKNINILHMRLWASLKKLKRYFKQCFIDGL